MRVSVVGLGKLGSPLLAVLAQKGHDVCGVDLNPETVARINSGIAPVQEPQLQELLTEHASRIRATADWRAAITETDVTCVIVPTPSGPDGAFRNDHLLSSIDEIGAVLRHKLGYHLVVINSTTMPGSVGGPIQQRLEAAVGKPVGAEIGLCYNPEFVALGNVVEGLLHPDFVLIGESDDRAGTVLERLYRSIVDRSVPISRMSLVNAELVKISLNTFVTTKISFANMLGEICDRLPGADVDVVTAAIGQDSRIGRKYLRGATGYGGPCFPRDTVAFCRMAERVGLDAPLASAAHAINQRQVVRLANIVTERTKAGERVSILGLSYKPDTGVIEESQGIMLATALYESGRNVVAHDPLASGAARAALASGISVAASLVEAVAEADALVVMVPWDEYRAFFASWTGNGRTRLVIDGWRVVNHPTGLTPVHIVQLGKNETLLS